MSQEKEIMIDTFASFKELYDASLQAGKTIIEFSYPVGDRKITVTCPLYIGPAAAYNWLKHHQLTAEKALYQVI